MIHTYQTHHSHWHAHAEAEISFAMQKTKQEEYKSKAIPKPTQKPRNLLQRLPEDSSSDDDSPFDAYYETSEEEAKK